MCIFWLSLKWVMALLPGHFWEHNLHPLYLCPHHFCHTHYCQHHLCPFYFHHHSPSLSLPMPTTRPVSPLHLSSPFLSSPLAPTSFVFPLIPLYPSVFPPIPPTPLVFLLLVPSAMSLSLWLSSPVSLLFSLSPRLYSLLPP